MTYLNITYKGKPINELVDPNIPIIVIIYKKSNHLHLTHMATSYQYIFDLLLNYLDIEKRNYKTAYGCKLVPGGRNQQFYLELI